MCSENDPVWIECSLFVMIGKGFDHCENVCLCDGRWHVPNLYFSLDVEAEGSNQFKIDGLID